MQFLGPENCYGSYAECGVRSAECGVRSAECGVVYRTKPAEGNPSSTFIPRRSLLISLTPDVAKAGA